jgi:hypothetical protein
MHRSNAVWAVLLGCVCVVLTGCMPKMTVADMKAQMPKRPAELDRLNAFVGKWQGDGEMKFANMDEPLKFSGTSEMKWEGDKWYIVGHGVMKLVDFPETQGLETWTYDISAKKYRSFYVDSMGMSGMSEARFDEKTGTWHMISTSYSAWGKSEMKGTCRFPNPDTMEWNMTECMGLMKIMDMHGTSKRVK